jgi:hypothetical protein
MMSAAIELNPTPSIDLSAVRLVNKSSKSTSRNISIEWRSRNPNRSNSTQRRRYFTGIRPRLNQYLVNNRL